MQGIVDDMWMGRSPEAGQVRLTKMEPVNKLILQELAMLIGVQFVQVTGLGLGRGTAAAHDRQPTVGTGARQ